MSELESVMERLEDDTKTRVDHSTALLQEKSSEVAQYRLDNDRLKVLTRTYSTTPFCLNALVDGRKI